MTKRDYYENKEVFKRDNDVNLEAKLFYYDKGVPVVVVGIGLGGCARRDALVDGLIERGYAVRMFSPRGSGGSDGNLTIDNYISDMNFLLEDTAYKFGEKPYGISHSFGGYALAKILGEKDTVKKAALLAPLLNLSEQNPNFLNNYFKRLLKTNKIGFELEFLLDIYNRFLSPHKEFREDLVLDRQRFSKKSNDVFLFLESLYNAKPNNGKVKSPIAVHLPGKSNLGFRIKDLNKLKERWQELQIHDSYVKIYPDLDHWFSNGKGFFQSKEGESVIDDIANYFYKK